MELIQSAAIQVQQTFFYTLLTGMGSLALMVITFLVARFIKQYDTIIKTLQQEQRENVLIFDRKLDALKDEIREELIKINEDKYKYRLEQTKAIANIATTQGLMIATLKDMQIEQKLFFKEAKKKNNE